MDTFSRAVRLDEADAELRPAPATPLIPDGARTATIGSLLFLAGSGAYYVMPAYLSAVATQAGLSSARVGLLAGAENLGIALASLVTSLLLGRIGRRTLSSCALLCVVGDLLTGFADHFTPLLVLRFLTGLLGEGPCYAASFVVLGMAPKPDRTIGIAMTLVVLIAAGTLACSSGLLHALGPAGLFVPFALSALFLMASLGRLTGLNKADATAPVAGAARSSRKAIITLAGMCLWFAAPGLFWAFAETSAGSHGFSQGFLDHALSVATIVGFAGAMLPVVLGDRIGRLVPILVTTIGLAVAIRCYDAARAPEMITIGLSLFNVSWNCSAVYQLAALTTLDRTGTYSGLGAVAQLLGLAIGPVLGGALIGPFGYGIVPVASAALASAGLVLFVGALAGRPIRSPDTSSRGTMS